MICFLSTALPPGPITTTTLSPADQAFVATLQNIFTSYDTAATKTALYEQFTGTVGLTAESSNMFIDSIQKFLTVLSPNPTGEQIAAFEQIRNDHITNFVKLIESQPGLKNITTDPKYLSNPNAKALLDTLQFVKVSLSTLNATAAFSFFTNPENTAALLGAMKLMKTVSDQVVAAGNIKNHPVEPNHHFSVLT
jgi:hypothetical protein